MYLIIIIKILAAIIIDNIHKKGFHNFQDLYSLSTADHYHEVDKRMAE